MIIIPDIHGRYFWKEAVMKNLGREHILFLGDYCDPYDYEGEPSYEVIPRFKEILSFKQEHPEDITLLLGNHDMHYIDKDLGGSRYDFVKAVWIKKLLIENADLFSIAETCTEGGRRLLFSHAGIRKGWLEAHDGVFVDHEPEAVCKRLNDMWRDGQQRQELLHILADVSAARWGSARFGSPIWNDMSDMADDPDEFPGWYQVFGHSQQEENPVIGEHIACLDCRRAFRIDDRGIFELH